MNIDLRLRDRKGTLGVLNLFPNLKDKPFIFFKCTIRGCNSKKERSISGRFLMCLSTFCLKVHCFLNRVKYNDGLT